MGDPQLFKVSIRPSDWGSSSEVTLPDADQDGVPSSMDAHDLRWMKAVVISISPKSSAGDLNPKPLLPSTHKSKPSTPNP